MKADPLTAARQFAVISSIFALLIMLFVAGCQKPNDPSARNAADARFIYVHPEKNIPQLIVMLKPGASATDFNTWLDTTQRRIGNSNPLVVARSCQNCDDNLKLLSGQGAEVYISEQTASGGTGVRSMARPGGGRGPSGADGPIYYSVNFPVVLVDSIQKASQFGLRPLRSSTKRSVTVAVFDTGIDPDSIGTGLFYKGFVESCLGMGSKDGWNFANNTSSFRDDQSNKHGTIVTGFIVDQVYKYGNNSIRILPVKVFSGDGPAYLYDILCGFSYAAKQGAEIINASLGFYAPKYLKPSTVLDSSAFLLGKYIETYLLPKHILLIAAAGNRTDAIEDTLFRSYSAAERRNLDNVCFYPASLASKLQNVIAVTTVDSTRASPFQNFSPHVVDVGVYADNTTSFSFNNPFDGSFTVVGSSFATPVVTGKICANYYLLESLLSTSSFRKDSIWNRLDAIPGITGHNTLLEGEGKFIKSRVMRK